MRLSVMTFNVRGSFHEDGDNHWVHRRALNVATIQKYAPDIIGFQEAQSGNLEAYAVDLVNYDVEYGPISIREGNHSERVPLYWQRSRFNRVDAGGFYLSETPEVESPCWESTLVRAVTWVHLRDLASNAEFVVLNTHFPYELESESARAASARLTAQRLNSIAQATLPQLIMADFNTLPGSDAYQVFLDAGYVDTYTAAGNIHAVNTFHGFQGSAFPATGYRIDWILAKNGVRSWATHRCDVMTDEASPLYPSDHYPVLTDLELTRS